MNQMISQIVKATKEDLLIKKKTIPLAELMVTARSVSSQSTFQKSIEDGFDLKKIGFIAEIKLSSPTAKDLGDKESIVPRALDYEQSLVDAISIITEPHFFNGHTAFVTNVKEKVSVSILQKDFVVDEYQIFESKVIGADALLLIVKLVDLETLQYFVDQALSLGIEPVVEINDQEDLQKALQTNTRVIAVNARDLDTFTVDIDKACLLLQQIPDEYLRLGFSGIQSSREVQKYKDAGAKGVLVGTNLMKVTDVQSSIKELRNVH